MIPSSKLCCRSQEAFQIQATPAEKISMHSFYPSTLIPESHCSSCPPACGEPHRLSLVHLRRLRFALLLGAFLLHVEILRDRRPRGCLVRSNAFGQLLDRVARASLRVQVSTCHMACVEIRAAIYLLIVLALRLVCVFVRGVHDVYAPTKSGMRFGYELILNSGY
jgi:hypothetical protein